MLMSQCVFQPSCPAVGRPPACCHFTDLHKPVQEDGPHLGLQMWMLLQHVGVLRVGPVLLQHVAPHHILTGPADKYRSINSKSTHRKNRRKQLENKCCDRQPDLDLLPSDAQNKVKLLTYFFRSTMISYMYCLLTKH